MTKKVANNLVAKKSEKSANVPKRSPGRPKSEGGLNTFPTGIRIPIAEKKRLERMAKREGVGYQTLMKRWVLERLAIEEQKVREQSGINNLVRDIFGVP